MQMIFWMDFCVRCAGVIWMISMRRVMQELAKIARLMAMNKGDFKEQATEVLEYLNAKRGKKYRPTDNTLKLIIGRLKEGYTVGNCKYVIDVKCADWIGTAQEKYIDYTTLFRPSNFPKYLEQTFEEVSKKDMSSRDMKRQQSMNVLYQFAQGGEQRGQIGNVSLPSGRTDSLPGVWD